eukprot:scaffold1535_cov382-Prasinococcus_capsulatus_cf.AAC.67
MCQSPGKASQPFVKLLMRLRLAFRNGLRLRCLCLCDGLAPQQLRGRQQGRHHGNCLGLPLRAASAGRSDDEAHRGAKGLPMLASTVDTSTPAAPNTTGMRSTPRQLAPRPTDGALAHAAPLYE